MEVNYRFQFEELAAQYENFRQPLVALKVNQKDICKKYIISDICVDLTSGFEASVAEFSVYDAYDTGSASFDFASLKEYVLLGAKVELALGYEKKTKQIFVGAVTRVSFCHEKEEIPCVRVAAMDVKGIMMAGGYAKQISVSSYSEAVAQILKNTAYKKLKNKKIIRNLYVSDTPDALRTAPEGETDKTIEMVCESDYEFVVKAAKRFGFEFFTECGDVYFRKAKSDDATLLKIGPDTGMHSFNVTYDITGLVENVTVRGVNAGTGEVISHAEKFSNKISQGNKAQELIRGSSKVYLDSTIASEQDAQHRAASLMDRISYRYGSLTCELVGIPELLPAHFIVVDGLGKGADNRFYLTRVKHIVNRTGAYYVQLEGKCARAK